MYVTVIAKSPDEEIHQRLGEEIGTLESREPIRSEYQRASTFIVDIYLDIVTIIIPNGTHGATVARSTPDRKVVCSNQAGFKVVSFLRFFIVLEGFPSLIRSILRSSCSFK